MAVDMLLDLGLVIAVATVISGLLYLAGQPLLIGYILSGIVVGPLVLDLIQHPDSFQFLAHLGTVFLLFLVGLELNPKVLKTFGPVSILTGIGQMVLTFTVGYGLAIWLGFGGMAALYIGASLTFSSTIIVLKLLSDKNLLDRVFGRVAVGFLLVQDLVAMGLLVLVSTGGAQTVSGMETFFFGTVAALLVYLVGRFLLEEWVKRAAESRDLLFLFGIAWCLGIATLFAHLGLSAEIGALLAGIALANVPHHRYVRNVTKPLRDFFLILFFIMLGSQVHLQDLAALLVPALVLSAFVVLATPLVIMALMGYQGYSKRNGFYTGVTVAQISEFSLILVSLGLVQGHIGQEIVALVTLVALITIFSSTYLIQHAEQLYRWLAPYLSVFEQEHVKQTKIPEQDFDGVLFGYNRIGYGLFSALKEVHEKLLVIDHDPHVIDRLEQQDYTCMYGDAEDTELLEEITRAQPQLYVSTVPDVETNLMLVEFIRSKQKDSTIIAVANQVEDALRLYEQGADYVMTPHVMSGRHVSQLLKEAAQDSKKLKQEKKQHLEHLQQRKH